LQQVLQKEIKMKKEKVIFGFLIFILMLLCQIYGQIPFSSHTIAGGELSVNECRSVYAIDLDNDADMDILSASYFDNKIAWYENDGNQNFTIKTISTGANGATSVYAIDVDGDSDIDVLSASSNDNDIVWYENDGNQNFIYHSVITLNDSISGAIQVHASDLDNDSDIDILAASLFDYKIAWYENDGYQNFTTHNILQTSEGSSSVFATDLDSDLDVDILSSSFIDDRINWFENDGNQNFSEHIITTTTDGASSVFAIDIDGDQDIDILSSSYWDNKIAFYVNDGNQNFTTQIISTNAENAHSVYAVDLDDDLDIDVISASWNDDKIAWYENDGNQNFTEHIVSLNADGAWCLYVIDMDYDLDIDILSGSAHDNKVIWHENDGSQNFSDHFITISADGAWDVYAIDMDNDSDIDVLSASFENDKIAWYENDGMQNFTPFTITKNANGVKSVYAIDMDNDSDMDVLSASHYDNKIAWYENDGNQNFTEQIISTSANGAESVFTIDVDSDSDIDVFSASYYENRVEWYENDGNMNFTDHSLPAPANSPRSVFAIDLDNDNFIEILSASYNDHKIAWYDKDSSNNFIQNIVTTLAPGANSVYAIDMDADSDIDVLSSSFTDNGITWYENDGNQIFTEHFITFEAYGAECVFAIDMDGDGDIDVLSASSDDNKISWYENDGTQYFHSRIISNNAVGAKSVYAIDLDADLDIDVLSASYGDYKISWYKNLMPPDANFHTDTTHGIDSLHVNFIDDSRGGRTSWLWDFGDGSTSIEQNPSHTYFYVDTFTVSLTVSGPDGSDTFVRENYITVYNYTTADFSSDPTSGILPLTVHFTDSSTGTISDWYWDFENDGILDSYEQNPSHTYFEEDTFSVKLMVSNGFIADSLLKENYITTYYDSFPNLYNIEDIPNDQGGWVTVHFTKSLYDTDTLIHPESKIEFYTVEINYDSIWTAVNSTVAYGRSYYSVLVPTPIDSTTYSNGLIDFRLIAGMDEGNFVSNVLSGYSVDNLEPNAPLNLQGVLIQDTIVSLQWSANQEDDLQYYSVYRSIDDINFELIIESTDTTLIDTINISADSVMYAIKAVDYSGNYSNYSNFVNFVITGIQNNIGHKLDFRLNQNYPNPFNPTTKIKFDLPKPEKIKIEVFDLLGQKIKTLLNKPMPKGYHEVEFTAKNLPSGVYLYKIEAGKFQEVKKMILLR
jgi:PKD repeat protein